MQELCDGYFLGCEREQKPVTLMGLALALNVDRMTLFRYAKQRDIGGRDAGVCDILARACGRVAQAYEQSPRDDPRLGTFADRMLSRLGWACEETLTVQPGDRCLPTDPAEIDAMIAALQAAKTIRAQIAGEAEAAGSAICDG